MNKIEKWLNSTPYKDFDINTASADASFRKYYRLSSGDKSFLLMDASLEKESLKPFLDVTSKLLTVGVKAPNILEKNIKEGFLILEDFGSTHYLDILSENNFKSLYSKAIDEIVAMQQADISNLPIYDKKFLHFEMDLMQEWYFEKLLNKNLKDKEKKIIASTLDSISEVVLSQPQNIFVHRDFHSRNIMLTKDEKIGVIDYQDAMSGAITYDLVSLLKDCYIEFEENEIRKLALEFRDKIGLKTGDDEFIKWFDFMGMQRHIKVLGVFSRLFIRDKKHTYLNDIPLTLKYLFDTSNKYKETKALTQLLKEL
jgi:N-acetylmuramate 1-kinase